MGNSHLTTTFLFSMAALVAVGCAPLTNTSSGSGGSGCVAQVSEDTAGAQIAINRPGTTAGGQTGTTTYLAQAFLVTAAQMIPEVALKLDAITPANTTMTATINVQLEADSVVTTSGTASAPTTPGTVVSSNGITASNVGSVSANTLTTAPTFVDFCFSGAIGVNCPVAGTGATTAGVTLNAGQYYWIVVTTSTPGTSTSYVEWRGTNTTIPDNFGFVDLNNLGNWIPVNGIGTSNYNFDFRVGC